MGFSRKWVIIVIVLVVISLLGVGWYYGRNWKSTIQTKIAERIEKSTQGLYTLTYDDININILAGDISLKNVELIPDSTVYRQLVATEQASNNRFQVKLASLDITGLGIWNALIAKKLRIDRISFDTADVHLTSEQHTYNDSTQNSENESMYDQIKEVFKEVKIGEIALNQVNFKFSQLKNGQSSPLEVDSIRIKIVDFLLDERSVHDTTRLFYTKGIELDIPGFEYDLPNSPYKVKFDQFHIDSQSEHALLTMVELTPKISKLEYFRTDKENKALIFLKFDSLRLEKLDLAKMIENKLLYAKYAYIDGGSTSFHKDKRYQKDNVLKIGQAPHQQVMKLDQLIQFDTVFVKDVDISYSQHSDKYEQIGTITFQKAHGNITNLTNDTTQLARDKFMRADLQAKLMGSGLLRAQFGFDMLSEVGSHTYKGTLGKMQAPAFNGILTPLLNIEFESGNIRSISFDMQGTDYKNWGEFRFNYDDVKVNLLHKPEKDNKGSKKDILSFLINQILINDSNPTPDGTYRIGQVDYTRVPEYSHFKTIWNALFEGIQQSVGLGNATKVMDKTNEEQQEEPESKNIFEKTGDFFKRLFEKKENDQEKE